MVNFHFPDKGVNRILSWYNGTFYCGHEGYVYINGSAQMRRKMKEYRFSQPCPECIRSDAIRFRQQKNTEALEHTRHAELPLLEGSARQISWASTLRLDICQRLENYIAISSHHTYLAECWERQSGTAIDPGGDDLPQFFSGIGLLSAEYQAAVHLLDQQPLPEQFPDPAECDPGISDMASAEKICFFTGKSDLRRIDPYTFAGTSSRICGHKDRLTSAARLL